MKWNFENGLPIYTQIIDQITACIAAGEFKPGERLPSVRELATEAGVNPNTMQRALGELERRGIVFAERTNGRFVTEDELILKNLNQDIADRCIGEMFAKLREAGMSDDAIRNAVAKWKDK